MTQRVSRMAFPGCHTFLARRPGKSVLPFRIAVLILAFAVAPQQLFGSDSAFSHKDAGESGAFDFGAAEASVSTQTDAETADELFKLNYSVGKDGGAGIWTKGYPTDLSRESADEVRIRVQLADGTLANEIALKAEVKGTDGVQVIELQPTSGWSETHAPIEWERIGNLNEVVLVVTRIGGAEKVSGSLLFAVSFEKLSYWDKQSASVVSRVVAALLLAVLLGLSATFPMSWFAPRTGAMIAISDDATHRARRNPAWYSAALLRIP